MSGGHIPGAWPRPCSAFSASEWGKLRELELGLAPNMISNEGFPFDVDTGLVVCPVCGSNANEVVSAGVTPENMGCRIDLRCQRQHDWQLGLSPQGGGLFLAVSQGQK
jgi:hypothetical protein